jgi:hypothetical protein
MANNFSYQTNFTGIKYSNNPLAIDPNSFSNANNVYLNKYNALISRPPVTNQEYPIGAYTNGSILPIELKLVGTYNLYNGGIIYVVFATDTSRYILRYKSPTNTYSQIFTTITLQSYRDFTVTQYKQYYIIFSIDGTKVLDSNLVNGTWKSLDEVVDIPITSIQTGNEKLELPINQFTTSYKKKFVLKPDSDDTIYSLPLNETANISFPSQPNLSYDLTAANKYTRHRVLRQLYISPNISENVLISMVNDKIAVAHSDRVDISLDYGNSFKTVVYPTVASDKYKNTASLSEDGQCFFYVHEDGVYRYMLGTEQWLLIEVVLTPPIVVVGYDGVNIERQAVGLPISSAAIGANYCQFLTPEKFVFVLAHYTGSEWITVFYWKGLTLTNLVSGTTAGGIKVTSGNELLCSIATVNNTPIRIISPDINIWAANPYINKKSIKVIDNNTIAYAHKVTSNEIRLMILKAIPTHLEFYTDAWTEYSVFENYVTTTSITHVGSHALNLVELLSNTSNQISLLIKTTTSCYWHNRSITLTSTKYQNNTFGITFTLSFINNSANISVGDESNIAHKLDADKYLTGAAFKVVTESTTTTYPLTYITDLTVTSKVVVYGPYYLIFNDTTKLWYTNLPILTTLIYTYLGNVAFNKVPTAVFDDQNLWLGIGNTLWIANLIDNKLSASPINNNIFPKTITGIIPITATSKAIFFTDSITLCEELPLSDGSIIWQYYPLKFSVGIRHGDTVITTNDGKLTIFPTKFGLAALTYQIDIAATEQAITYLTDDIKTLWTEFYTSGPSIKIIHHNTQLLLSNGTNQILIYDFRTTGWYPQTLPANLKVTKLQPNAVNYEVLELQPQDAPLTPLTTVYQLSKEHDELYSYSQPYKDLGTIRILWHLTSQLLLLNAPNHYKNISQLVIDQIDSNELRQSAYLTTQVFRQLSNTVKPAIELIYNIDTFSKIVKKVNWWKVLGFKWQLENDAKSSYPTQLRLYNLSIKYDVSYEVK